MITKFKLFETIVMPPKIGDYILLDDELYDTYKQFYKYITSSDGIGQIISVEIEKGDTLHHKDKKLIVMFENIPEELTFNKQNFFNKDNTRKFSISSLKCWSDKKEDLVILINSKKFNL